MLYKGECAIEICCNSTRDCLDPEISTKCKGHVGTDLVTHTKRRNVFIFSEFLPAFVDMKTPNQFILKRGN